VAKRSLGLVLGVLALFVLAYFTADYMLAVVLDALRREGLIPGTRATWRFYAGLLKTVPGAAGLAATLVWGVLADRIGRPRLVLTLGLLMGASLAAVAAATSYYYLLAAFTVFGIAKIGIGPVIYALIPDLVPPEKRGAGYAAYYAPGVLGFAAGLALGVALYWRKAYLVAGATVAVMALLLYALTRGVRIGEAERAAIGEYRFREALRAAMNKTVTIMMLQIIPWTIPWGFIVVFAVDYIVTRWGVPKTLAALVLGVAALSITLGHVVGGLLGDRLVRRGDLLGRFRVSAIGIAVGYLAMLGMLAYPYPYGDTSLRALLPPTLLAAAGLMFTTFAYPNLSSVISDCVPPRYRGTVFALYNILNTAGWMIGPTLYGFLVGLLVPRFGEKDALMYAAVGLESLWLVSLAAWLLAARYYPRDRVAAQA